jgi:hypothetical protein
MKSTHCIRCSRTRRLEFAGHATKGKCLSLSANHDLNCGEQDGLLRSCVLLRVARRARMVGCSPEIGSGGGFSAALFTLGDSTQDIEWRNKKQTQNLSRR